MKELYNNSELIIGKFWKTSQDCRNNSKNYHIYLRIKSRKTENILEDGEVLNYVVAKKFWTNDQMQKLMKFSSNSKKINLNMEKK